MHTSSEKSEVFYQTVQNAGNVWLRETASPPLLEECFYISCRSTLAWGEESTQQDTPLETALATAGDKK